MRYAIFPASPDPAIRTQEEATLMAHGFCWRPPRDTENEMFKLQSAGVMMPWKDWWINLTLGRLEMAGRFTDPIQFETKNYRSVDDFLDTPDTAGDT